MDVKPEFAALKEKLVAMTAQYEAACEAVQGKGEEYIDFHARRLVEMAAHIIMSYLLIIDAQKNDAFARSAEVYTNKSEAWNNERASYIASFKLEDLAAFAAIKDEFVAEEN